MRTTKKVKVPAREEEVQDDFFCDVCKVSFNALSAKRHNSELDFVQMQRKVGVFYPDSQNFETETYDVCGTCWSNVIVPLMEKLGAKPRVEEYSW